jgi:uncharacterized protein DUF3300
MTRISRNFLIALLAFAAAMPLASGQARAAYSRAEIDQMLAPIALYPDPLLSQLLMAATFPEDVTEAARWSRAHAGVEGDAAVQMVQEYEWDPSVKSLVAFPRVLQRMEENPEWTRKLGDAFIVQEPVVMEAVQDLRRRAQANGQLASDERMRVVEQPGYIAIEPANPQYVYVPYYDPWLAYGTWWWPAYPPFYWRPWPGYVAYGPGFWWGAPIGLSVGFFYGGFDWHRRYAYVNRTDNYYVRRYAANGGVYPGRWQQNYWQRGGYTRYSGTAGTRQYSGTTATRQVQQTAPLQQAAPLRDSRREEWRRERSLTQPRVQAAPQQFASQQIAPRQQVAPRVDAQARQNWQARQDARVQRQAEPRRLEPRPAMPQAVAPAQRFERPQMRAEPRAQQHQQQRFERRAEQRGNGHHVN